MGLVSEDVPTAGGPSGSLPFGERTAFQQDRKTLESAGSPGQPQPQPGQQAQGPQPPQPPAAPPVQPAQSQPYGMQDMAPGGPVFSQPVFRPKYPWRRELATWANHPDAGPALRRLNALAQKGPNG